MSPTVEFERRDSLPRWLAYAAPLLTVLAALGIAAVPLVWIGVNPLVAYATVFVVQPSSIGGLADVLTTTLPLFLAGLAVYIPLKAGLWNVGAEGQLFVGAVVGSYVGLNADLPRPLLVPSMLIAATVVSALYGAIPGYLRAEHDVNEIISSLMLTFAATTFTGYLLRGPIQGSGGQTATDRLPEAAQLPTAFHPRLHVGVVALAVVGVFAYLLLSRTRFGYETTFAGSNPEAAAQAGISTYKVYVVVFVVGGCLAGLAGIIEVAGVHGRLFEDFSPQYGFTAIAVALLGRNGVLRVFLAAAFFGVLTAGGTTLAITQNVPTALIDVIVALTILCLLTAEFIKEYRIRLERGGSDPSAEGAA
ncbi:ABC transporter permease [Natronomonas sp.]|uniref:ABC transporter permease n=1 Tax=Natronomonas sp. TaxID=2184060 RepID=UPI00260489B7|nr:ABC transporter permease [Natronomonas sp.]